ncbi:hypothetical protein AURDEDRAFT_143966 [Auricularia subglabra TFB-10046 SS5]|nr:hypothetical protein AURDEDRAFT_143966 [Auricularia subglabra TFB-10046 SS5]
MGTLDTLPYEIFVNIIAELPWKDILRVQTVSKLFRAAHETSQHLQYLVELGAAGLVRNARLRYPHSSSDGKTYLTIWRENWRFVDWHAVDTIDLDGPVTFCDMIDGVFVLGTKSQRRHMTNIEFDLLDVLDTKSEERICPSWTVELAVPFVHVVFDPSKDLLVGIQNDVTATPASAANHSPYKMHILSFSTGLPHPEAQQHLLPVADYRIRRANSIKTEILEDLVAVHICSDQASLLADRYTIVNWRTGVIQLQYQTQVNSHSAFRLLSAGIILEASCDRGSFSQPLDIMLSLRTFVLQAVPHRLSPPYHSHPVAAFYLPRLAKGTQVNRLHFHATNTISQRRAAPFATAPFTPGAGPDNSVLALDVVLANGRAGVRPTANTMFFLPAPLIRRAMAPGAIIGQEVPWEDWGPPAARWMNSSLGPPMQGPGYATVGMQRWLVGFRALSHRGTKIMDFNPYPLRRETRPEERGDIITRATNLPVNNLFAETVYSALPYRECMCQRESQWLQFQGMALDEHIIGLKTVTPPGLPRRQEIESIYVLLMMPDVVQAELRDETDDDDTMEE